MKGIISRQLAYRQQKSSFLNPCVIPRGKSYIHFVLLSFLLSKSFSLLAKPICLQSLGGNTSERSAAPCMSLGLQLAIAISTGVFLKNQRQNRFDSGSSVSCSNTATSILQCHSNLGLLVRYVSFVVSGVKCGEPEMGNDSKESLDCKVPKQCIF